MLVIGEAPRQEK